MAYDTLTVASSDRTGTNAATPTTGVASNGIKLDNTTGDVMAIFHNTSAGAVVLETVNNPNIEALVDGMTVANLAVESVAAGEMVVLGPWLNSEYGNDDPDAGALPDGKTIVINYTSGDGGVWKAIRRGST